jgi:hypothetical protein
MKKNLNIQKSYDLIFIENNAVSWFRITKKRGNVNVVKSEKILVDFIYNQGVFSLASLEPAIGELITKFKLKEIGIILHLPTLLFQRISLSRDSLPREAILNYLKTNFPLPLDKYSFFYKEDKYQKFGSLSNFNIFFISREIIDGLLNVIEKYGIIPLFISPSIEAYYQYLVSKAIVDFNEEYLVFFVSNFSLTAILIKNLRIEKVIIDEIELDKLDKDLLVRIYNFLKSNFSPEGKILFLGDISFEKIEAIPNQQIFFQTKTLNILLEGSYSVFERVMNDEDLIDFLPIKPYFVYFLNRLPRAIAFVSLYTFVLGVAFGLSYLFINNRLTKEFLTLRDQKKTTLPVYSDEKSTKLKKIFELSSQLNTTTRDNFINLEKIVNFPELEEIELLGSNELKLVFRINNQDVPRIKESLMPILPETKKISEEYIDNQLKLRYNF